MASLRVGESPDIQVILSRSAAFSRRTSSGLSNLERWCSRIEDQGEEKRSCAARVVVALLECLLRRALDGTYVDLSSRFLYQAALKAEQGDDRSLEDSGVRMVNVITALAENGVPFESEWPSDGSIHDRIPPRLLDRKRNRKWKSGRRWRWYAVDRRPDGTYLLPGLLIPRIRRYINFGFPVTVGVPVGDSMPGRGVPSNGLVPFERGARPRDGHAFLIVGYRNRFDCGGTNGRRGAFRIRNSWGGDWGERGYGWLPYEYVRSNVASGFFSLTDRRFAKNKLLAAHAV